MSKHHKHLNKALKQIHFDNSKFEKRGGRYDWKNNLKTDKKLN